MKYTRFSLQKELQADSLCQDTGLERSITVKTSNGFTLLELLISMTILAVIAAIVFGALRIGSRAWEKGEADVEDQQRMRVVFDLIRHQISSASAIKEITAGDGKTFHMKGDSTSLEFLSYVPVFPGDTGMVHVKYRVLRKEGEESGRLAFFEQEIVFSDKELEDKGADGEKDFHTLIPVSPDFRFEYLDPVEQGQKPEWVDRWDGTETNGLPLAVRISMKDAKDGTVPGVIARIEQVDENRKAP